MTPGESLCSAGFALNEGITGLMIAGSDQLAAFLQINQEDLTQYFAMADRSECFTWHNGHQAHNGFLMKPQKEPFSIYFLQA